jgi:hypothetical protein
MTEPDRTAVEEARETLDSARDSFISALYTDQTTPNSTNDSALATARSAMSSAQTALNTAIGTWLSGATVTNDNDINRLDANIPIVLLPVRIETRFSGTNLLVRIFPDEIFLNRHEKALTPDELTAGQAYYALSATADLQDQWRQMVRLFGAQRSAYILRALTKTNGVTPTPLSRSGTWTRPGEAVLPDRWVVMTRRGNTRAYYAGKPIPEPLPMTPDPSAAAADQATLPNGYAIDGKLQWTVDFQTAVNVGMALSIPLSSTDQTQGFDRIVAFGVKTSMRGQDSQVALERLLDAHHYTRGFAFLRQESVTNNTKDRPTEYPPADEQGANSFQLERAHPPPKAGDWGDTFESVIEAPADGLYWSQILGLDNGVVENVDRSHEFEHFFASMANTAMWALTYRSFLKFNMSPIFSDASILNAKNYFVNNVFARGPAPAFRIGQVPYGLLPVTSLQRWKKDTTDTSTDVGVETAILDPLNRALAVWKSASSKVNRVVANSSTPDLDLIKTLSLYPTMRELRVRFGAGGLLLYNAFLFIGWDVALPFAALDKATVDLFRRLGHPEWKPRMGRTVWWNCAPLDTTSLVDLDKNLREDAGLGSNSYLVALSKADVQLANDTVPNKPNPEPLLYTLLRISTLTEYALTADAALVNAHVSGYSAWPNSEVFGMTNLPTGSIIGAMTETLIRYPSVTGTADLAAFAAGRANAQGTALGILSIASTAELDRLLRESLDLSSHRLDAWATAFAYRRLVNLRGGNILGQVSASPSGPNQHVSHMGAYGWVEDVRPVARTTQTGPDGNPVEVDSTNGGFIHCPGSTHAMTAAALRSGYLSFSGEDPQKYAVDLSSRRVRGATQILDEMRNGQHAGAVLGYRFERALQDANASVPGANAARFAFRKVYPLVAGKNGVDTSQPADTVAARNVVDGLALYRAYRAGTVPFGTNGLPSTGTALYTAVVAQLNQLIALVDSVADLIVAEGVFQLARGNLPAAPASLDNLVSGGVPPAPEIARSPRSGVGLTHRVVYLFPSDAATSPPSTWTASATPRAAADPVLNAWLGTIIGDPSKVTAKVSYTDSTSAQKTATVYLNAPASNSSAKNLGLQPNQGSLLDARTIFAAIGDDASNTNVTVDYSASSTRDPSVDRTFPEILELAGTLGAALGASRPLAPTDLLSPSDATGYTLGSTNPTELATRAQSAFSALTSALGALTTSAPSTFNPATATTAQLTALRGAIRGAAAIAPERAFTTLGESAADLFASATALIAELTRRKASAPPQPPNPPLPTDPNDILQFAFDTFKAVFGSDMFVMPQVDIPSGTQDALSAEFTTAGRSSLLGSDDGAPARFLQQAMHGRPQLASYRKFSLYARALGATPTRADVLQLPKPNSGETWLGLKFTTPPVESRVSLLFLTQGSTFPSTSSVNPSPPPANITTWRGIVLDHWTEVIPAKTQPTSIAFNHNSPHAEAPQCVLVAVPPNVAANQKWSTADLIATLEETMDLYKIRAVDRELLDLGQLLPSAVIPLNLDAAITTSASPPGNTASVPSIFSGGFL